MRHKVQIVISVLFFLTTVTSCSIFKTKQGTKEKDKETIESANIHTFGSDYKGDKSVDVVFKGVLQQEIFFPPPCKLDYYAIVFKYKISEILKGSYDREYLLIIEQCPETKGDPFFKKDSTYQITANLNNYDSHEWQVFNYYQTSDIPIYWSISTEKDW